MKVAIKNYVFSTSGRTITFSDYLVGGIRLDSVELIVDVTINKILYNFADPVVSATVATNVLTLSSIPGSAQNTDSLLIFYDDPNASQNVTNTSLAAGEDLTNKVLGTHDKPVSGIQYSPSRYSPLTTLTKDVIKSSPGNLIRMYATNDDATVRYLLFYNQITAPTAGSVPLFGLKMPAGSANNPGTLELGEKFFTNGGDWFSTGIAFAISTTLATFTDSATPTEHIVVARFV